MWFLAEPKYFQTKKLASIWTLRRSKEVKGGQATSQSKLYDNEAPTLCSWFRMMDWEFRKGIIWVHGKLKEPAVEAKLEQNKGIV